MTITIKYEIVSISATKRGICKCGKKTTRKQRFYQTINPFNKNSKGEIKDYSEILREITIEKEEWLNEPILHQKCEE